jgi:hypothetical protein
MVLPSLPPYFNALVFINNPNIPAHIRDFLFYLYFSCSEFLPSLYGLCRRCVRRMNCVRL